MKKKARLPSDYQEVKWIESHGNEWINTNVNEKAGETNTHIINVSFSVQSKDISAFSIFGKHSSNNYGAMRLQYDINRFVIEAKSYILRINRSIDDILNKKINFFINPNGDNVIVSFDNSEYTIGKSNSRDANLKYALFSGSTDQRHSLPIGMIRVYKFSIKTPERNIVNFVPCYRKSDGVIGMYDLCGSICPLTNTPFYINAGTGTFTKGADVL